MTLPRIGPRLRVALQLGVSAALLAFLLTRVDWQRAAALVDAAAPGLVALLLLIQVWDRVLMALKWHQLLQVLGGALSRAAAIRVYYESTLIGFALPFGGLGPDIVRFVRLRSRGIEAHVTLASMIMERLIGAVATLALVAAGLLVLARLAPGEALREFAWLLAAAVIGAGVAGATVVFHPGASRALARLFRLRPLLARPAIAKYVDAAAAYRRRRPLLAVNLGLSIIEQLTPVLAFWVGSHALAAPLPWAVCLAVAPVTVLIQRLPISYAGLGLREGSAAALLVALGFDYSAALVLLMVLFAVFLVSLLPGALFLALGDRRPAGSPGGRPAAAEPAPLDRSLSSE